MFVQDFTEGLTYQDLPEDELWILRRSLLDTLGIATNRILNCLSLVSFRQSVT